jgi:hypothetical protein
MKFGEPPNRRLQPTAAGSAALPYSWSRHRPYNVLPRRVLSVGRFTTGC